MAAILSRPQCVLKELYASQLLTLLLNHSWLQVLANKSLLNMPGIRFTFTLKRKPLYYLLNIIIPTMVLALLSALNFAAPLGSGEKLSLGISTLLAFSVFMLILQDNTPQSDSPLLGKLPAGCVSRQWSLLPWQQSSWGQQGAHLGPVGPRNESCAAIG